MHLLHNGWFDLFVVWFVLSNVVSTMPPLPDNASYGMKWFYAALHALAANGKNAVAIYKSFSNGSNGLTPPAQ